MLDTGRGLPVKIIDRTLPALLQKNDEIGPENIMYLYEMLKKLGIDYFEIDEKVIARIGSNLPSCSLIYRIESKNDLDFLDYGIQMCIVPEDLLCDMRLVEKLYRKNIKIYGEIRVDDLETLMNLKNHGALQTYFVKNYRILGLNSFASSIWVDEAANIERTFNSRIDICPENKYKNGVAVALEAVMSGAESVTVSFMGIGSRNGFAALEELLIACRVLLGSRIDGKLKLLKYLGEYVMKIARIKISESKPVLGKNIFNYESGIHADGIYKNPVTYEPYSPQLIGRERKLLIGKHSGCKAVKTKLRDLGVIIEEKDLSGILELVRKKSIFLGRSLTDDEILDICEIDSNINIEASGALSLLRRDTVAG